MTDIANTKSERLVFEIELKCDVGNERESAQELADSNEMEFMFEK